jgi:hypothetical protein
MDYNLHIEKYKNKDNDLSTPLINRQIPQQNIDANFIYNHQVVNAMPINQELLNRKEVYLTRQDEDWTTVFYSKKLFYFFLVSSILTYILVIALIFLYQ